MARTAHDPEKDMPFTRINYRLLLAGVGIVLVGYMLMAGGGSGDPNVFIKEEIFSERRITVAPIVCLLGYLFVIHAIMKRPAQDQEV
jgi:DUF3098 family protein